jgi:RNA polymerase sigma-70 factor (ECF subfamily)
MITPSPDQAAEREWLRDLSQGDERALRRIFDRYYPSLVREVYRLVGDADAGKDLAQEVFVELWRRRETLEVQVSLGAYLRRAAVNRAINYLKSRRRLVLEDPDRMPDRPDPAPGELEGRHETASREDALHRAVQSLPERCREVFTLSRFAELSHREIADQLGISVKTIENQITKAMKLLRAALVDRAEMSPVVIWLVKWWGDS